MLSCFKNSPFFLLYPNAIQSRTLLRIATCAARFSSAGLFPKPGGRLEISLIRLGNKRLSTVCLASLSIYAAQGRRLKLTQKKTQPFKQSERQKKHLKKGVLVAWVVNLLTGIAQEIGVWLLTYSSRHILLDVTEIRGLPQCCGEMQLADFSQRRGYPLLLLLYAGVAYSNDLYSSSSSCFIAQLMHRTPRVDVCRVVFILHDGRVFHQWALRNVPSLRRERSAEVIGDRVEDAAAWGEYDQVIFAAIEWPAFV